jgi:phenylalanyl-tRNA synthetase alpha chain
MLEQKILNIKNTALAEINKALTKERVFDLRVKYLGRKSEFNKILKGIKDLSDEEKKKVGHLANVTKREVEGEFEKMEKLIKAKSFNHKAERIDITIPGKKIARGHLHPITKVQNEIEDIFTSMGFEIADGPEVETEWYNFDSLNIPADHPARDAWDTFWIKPRINADQNADKRGNQRMALRPHTSPVQIRYMQKNKPPFRIIVPGKCFRREATDAAHEHTFYQFEALVVGEDINVGHFKYIGEQFFSKFFKKDVKVRLRPSYFPFTEPSFEFDISCLICNGKRCKSCKDNGWLEIGGAGMVNQEVFVAAGYPRNKYQGFAWGFGLERLAMMKWKIDDIRLFESGDLRFINQF